MIGAYYDKIYKTFAFAAMKIPANALHGTVVGQDNKPLANSPVFVMANGSLYRTQSDGQGRWRLPQEINGECAVQSGSSLGKVIPECSKAGAIKLRQ
jgi:hypothetical protein